jgi:hypothetical protein
MLQIAQLYVNRCRASQGTPRYHLLRQRADAYIKDLPEAEQGRLQFELSEPADQKLFDEQLSDSVENFFVGSRVENGRVTIPVNMLETMNVVLRKTMIRLFDLLNQLESQYKILQEFDIAEEVSFHSIIQCYETIQWLSYDYAYEYKNAVNIAVDLEPNNKNMIILQLSEVLFALITEHPESYAFRSLSGFRYENTYVSKAVFFYLIHLFFQPSTRQLSMERLNVAIQNLTVLHRESGSLFNFCFQKVNQSRIHYMIEVPYLFDYVKAKSMNHANGIINSLFNLKIFHAPSYQTIMKDAMHASLSTDPVLFFYLFVYIEDHAEMAEEFRTMVVESFDAFHEHHSDFVAHCLFNKIISSVASPCLPYDIYHEVCELEIFYNWGRDKCHNEQQEHAFIHYCYNALNKIKTDDTDMDDSFVKKIMSEYEQCFGSNYSLMRLSSCGSSDSLNEDFSSKCRPSINDLTK